MLSVIIPAHNEADWIGACLDSLLAEAAPIGGAQVVVVANGCIDKTVDIAESFRARAETGKWDMVVLDLPGLGKPAALNAGDAVASGEMRVYLDADVVVGRGLVAAIAAELDVDTPRYVSGRPRIAPARSAVTRAYAGFWQNLPFARSIAPGFGLFAVNARGRERWGEYPHLISDDTYVRLLFSPHERVEVPFEYQWPMVEGFKALVKVRRRQDAGVHEIKREHPALMDNEGKEKLGKGDILGRLMRNPVGFAVYATVSIAVRAKSSDGSWSRGR